MFVKRPYMIRGPPPEQNPGYATGGRYTASNDPPTFRYPCYSSRRRCLKKGSSFQLDLLS